MIKDKKLRARFDKYAKDQSDWHYINQFWTWKDGKAHMVEGMEPVGQILKKLGEFTQLLRSSANDSEKAIAIAWLEHLVGDIHQPLHVSARVTEYDPKGDRGGNAFFLTPKGTKRADQDNLHSFWDGAIDRYMPNKDMCEGAYYEPIAESIMKLHPYGKMKERLSPEKFNVWEQESLYIATTEVYKDVKFGEKPSDKYTKKAFEIAQERLALGGYRLGSLFNEIFGASSSSTPASTPAKQ
jgi:curved DNA-binding protein CbpA